jgi:hypothetical protein
MSGTSAWLSIPPFHVDFSKRVQFFSEINIRPSSDSFALNMISGMSDHDLIWTVRLGDPVALHCDKSVGKARFATNHCGRVSKNWPFMEPWAVGEVVSIFKDPNRKSPGSIDAACEIKLEIRWFYREGELPGKSSTSESNHLKCEEIFESDVYTEVEPSSLLAPVELHEYACFVPDVKTKQGMPLVEFFCNSFWSANRKSLVPISDLGSRVARGRARSKRMGNDASFRAALEVLDRGKVKCFSNAPMVAKDNDLWTMAFRKVIQKLSLTDASKEAYNDGSILIGREKERREIKSFLKSAITHKSAENNKSSVLVAGPPGVGKTAVRFINKVSIFAKE